MAMKKAVTLKDFGIKPGERVPRHVAIKIAAAIPANQVQMGIATIGGASKAVSSKLLAERAQEQQEAMVKKAVAEALAQIGVEAPDEDKKRAKAEAEAKARAEAAAKAKAEAEAEEGKKDGESSDKG